MARVIAYETYKSYAKKYGIKITKKVNNKRVYKSMRQLSRDIYNYESKHPVKNGLYYN